ncbi:exosortase-associated protein EpsI, B-type [Sphaerotilus sp.]|uniref:exosortase-associated protein EpsI, B-type n=1 Tax=Sphaerotilus sp. TaxID=2093942 RepID=UPI002ACD4D32|nr:exosortase-associated protein EpsI, B-type [Sphaerotilus sp.]MDZ7858015.1 EpsI family protein [Sphaerotilus sp.]
MNKRSLTAIVAAVLMSLTAASANHLKPTQHFSDTRGGKTLNQIIPGQFGRWQQQEISSGIVNPQQQQLLDELYSEQVSRTYISDQGYRIMLSIAYGKNQNDSFQVHLPEICYPAQGFQVVSSAPTTIDTPFGTIPAKQLKTTYQSQRIEPVTYWTTIGNHAVRSGTDKKLKEIQYAMEGQIADGLLFRVSSVDPNLPRAFDAQLNFVSEMMSSLSPGDRLRLAGLTR